MLNIICQVLFYYFLKIPFCHMIRQISSCFRKFLETPYSRDSLLYNHILVLYLCSSNSENFGAIFVSIRSLISIRFELILISFVIHHLTLIIIISSKTLSSVFLPESCRIRHRANQGSKNRDNKKRIIKKGLSPSVD